MAKGDLPFDRFDVGPKLEPQLRLYRRLWLSRVDLDEAAATIDEILRRKLPLPRKNRPSPLLMALTTALVVSYARPFVNSRGQAALAEKSLPGSLLRALTSYERSFHEALIEIRHQEVAHSDADAMQLSLKLLGDGDHAILKVSREPFRRTDLRALRRIINKLLRERSTCAARNCAQYYLIVFGCELWQYRLTSQSTRTVASVASRRVLRPVTSTVSRYLHGSIKRHESFLHIRPERSKVFSCEAFLHRERHWQSRLRPHLACGCDTQGKAHC